MPSKVLLIVVAAGLVAPGSAFAGVSMTARDIPLGQGRTLSSETRPPRFDMVGVHWRGSGTVVFRTRNAAGRWTGWQPADADSGPDPASSENRLPGWHLGGLAWTGESTAIRFRTIGAVTRLRAYYVESTVEKLGSRRLAVAGEPLIIPRAAWGANEEIRRAPPKYFDGVHFAVVHHTAGSNAYTRADSAAIVRGIEVYHVVANGWDDIGYNFLVDKYGQVFEGRYGGIDKAVIGAHAWGFNAGSVGVAMIGDYNSTRISAAARRSLERLLAWKLDLSHVDPLSTLTWQSTGSPRFPKGTPVFLRAISGHRDTYFTDCPGNALYAELPGIARDVSRIGLPKLYAPAVTGKLGGRVDFSGRLSGAVPWAVTVTNSAGAQVAQDSGTGPSLAWTWDSSSAPPDRYTWTIAGPASLLGASGTLGMKAAALAFQKTVAALAQIAPGGDPSDDTATISYTLTRPATVTATLIDANGVDIASPFAGAQPAGAESFVFTPPPGLPTGAYSLQLTATGGGGQIATSSVPVVVDPTLDGFTVEPPLASLANGGAFVATFTITAGPVPARFDVLRGATVVATPTVTTLAPGRQSLTWNGELADGTTAPDGVYTLALTVTDSSLTFTRTATVTVDSTPPAITPISYANLRFRISEPAALTLAVGSKRYTRTLRQAGVVAFWLRPQPAAYTLTAVDPAGNSSSVGYPRK
jgi:N-acetylmuramoyl-L-alanine amidase/FlgD Ig-like domain